VLQNIEFAAVGAYRADVALHDLDVQAAVDALAHPHHAEEEQRQPPAAYLADCGRSRGHFRPGGMRVAAGPGPLPPRPGCSAPSAERDVVARGPWPAAIMAGAVVVNAHPAGPDHDRGDPVVAAAVVGVSGRIPRYCDLSPATAMRCTSSCARVVAAMVMVTTVALLALGTSTLTR